MRLIASLIALFSIRLVTASVAQDILETKSTGVIDVKSGKTCGGARPTSAFILSWAMQLFLTFCPQKRLLHFPVPMATSTGWTVVSTATMDGNRALCAWKTSLPIHSPPLIKNLTALSRHALNILKSLKNMVLNTASPQSSWLLLRCKKAHAILRLLAVVENKVWCKSLSRNVLVLQRQAAKTPCASSCYDAFYIDTYTGLRNLISTLLPSTSPIPWNFIRATLSWPLAHTTVGTVD